MHGNTIAEGTNRFEDQIRRVGFFGGKFATARTYNLPLLSLPSLPYSSPFPIPFPFKKKIGYCNGCM